MESNLSNNPAIQRVNYSATMPSQAAVPSSLIKRLVQLTYLIKNKTSLPYYLLRPHRLITN